MKTKTVLIIATLMLSMGLIASNSKVVTNKKYEEYGRTEEKTLVLEGNVPNKKSVTKFDLLGSVQEKTIYQWNKQSSSWLPVHRRVFSHNLKEQKLIVSFVKWDRESNRWSEYAEISTYDRKDDGVLSMVDSEFLKSNTLKK